MLNNYYCYAGSINHQIFLIIIIQTGLPTGPLLHLPFKGILLLLVLVPSFLFSFSREQPVLFQIQDIFNLKPTYIHKIGSPKKTR
jgi:hypothetical protein